MGQSQFSWRDGESKTQSHLKETVGGQSCFLIASTEWSLLEVGLNASPEVQTCCLKVASWLASQSLLLFFHESPLGTGPPSKELCFPALLISRFGHMTESCQWKVSGRDVSRALKTADVRYLHSLFPSLSG